MSVDLQSPEGPPPGGEARDTTGTKRRRLAWRAFVVGLLLLVAYALYGGRLGGASSPREVNGELQQLTYPGVFGGSQVEPVVPGYERVQVAGFGDDPARGPRAALQGVLKLTRAGGLLFEVRATLSPEEREYLLARSPYDCATATETRLLETVNGVEIRAVQRGLLFRWLPSSVMLCGTRVQDGVMVHASGFAADATWHREAAAIRRMLQTWKVDVEEVPRDADGCRIHTEHDPPLYVKFRSEALAEAGVVNADTFEWIDLPYRDDDSVGRFTPDLLDEVAGLCAEEQARFARVVEGGASPESPAAQDAHHAFQARCGPLFPTLRFFGHDTLEPGALPRPSAGWSVGLDASYAPALCLPESPSE